MLAAAQAVVATSAWTRRRVLDRHGLRADRVHVAEPGADPAPLVAADRRRQRAACASRPSSRPRATTCCSTRWPSVTDLPWTLTLVGSLARDPPTSTTCGGSSRRAASSSASGSRVALVGPALEARVVAAPTCSSCRRGRRPTAWSSARRCRTGSRSSPPTSAGAARPGPRVGRRTRPGCSCRPTTPVALADALRRWLEDGDLRRGAASRCRGPAYDVDRVGPHSGAGRGRARRGRAMRSPLAAAPGCRCRAGTPALAGRCRSVRRRAPPRRRLVADVGLRDRRHHDRLLRLALAPRVARPRSARPARLGRRGVLPLAVPEPHDSRRSRGRRAPRGAPRPRGRRRGAGAPRAVVWERSAGQVVQVVLTVVVLLVAPSPVHDAARWLAVALAVAALVGVVVGRAMARTGRVPDGRDRHSLLARTSVALVADVRDGTARRACLAGRGARVGAGGRRAHHDVPRGRTTAGSSRRGPARPARPPGPRSR